ncbi:enoyl-CoA hydratase domain-containing protein 3, mitochondrial isoform X2 [Ornithorhynchus anatinus]|uniref:enoyl-CoA hydratase domain-containing protein 3, mitochondrial isoform X2 n=1 Tax=Ornithorhynchus anatinus TaxID=9258 RepID=UPI000454501B|nr:enoyl-CoA hydratase domain-containing protein 3, mitochondrial isoform X2 [Ornithorhynchus anatinus]
MAALRWRGRGPVAGLGLRLLGPPFLGPPRASACRRGASSGPIRPTSARQRDGIRNIILNNPKKRNALSLSMLNSLRNDILHEAESKDLRVIIISAEGPVFSSGHDLKEFTDEQGPDYHMEVFQTCSEVALEMLFTGEPISAQDALLHGLLSKVVPEEELEEETMRIARKICASSRSVVALGKAIFYRQMSEDLGTAYRLTSQAMVDNLGMQDGKEGIQAFIQKRKPVWCHS